MNKICLITGASGLIGTRCARLLRDSGWNVIPMTRHPEAHAVKFHLGEPVAPAIFKNVDALIHCAHDFSARTPEEIESINVAGSIELLRTAFESGVKKIIFISSIGAFENCRSAYGRGKMRVEQFVREHGGAILRPGLVYGDANKGMFATLSKVAALPLSPVFGNGKQPLYLVHVDDVAQAIVRALDKEGGDDPITIAYPEPFAFRDVLTLINQSRGKKTRFFSVPTGLALFGLKTAEAIGLKLPIKSDSILGLIDVNPCVDFTKMTRLGILPRKFPA